MEASEQDLLDLIGLMPDKPISLKELKCSKCGKVISYIVDVAVLWNCTILCGDCTLRCAAYIDPLLK